MLTHKRILSLFCCLILLGGMMVLPAQAADAPAAWAAEEVEAAIALGLVPQDLQNQYEAEITRAEFCRLAVACLNEADRVNGWNLTPDASVSFTDTSDADVLTAVGLGIVKGDGTGLFYPDQGITRQEAAVMLYNTLKAMGAPIQSVGSSFADQESIASWAQEAVSAIVGWGVMGGTGGGGFSPLTPYSRQQAYVTMYRLLSSVYMKMDVYSATLQPGERFQLSCAYATGAIDASWSSSDPSVVAVSGANSTVTLTAIKAGTATVTCRSGDFRMSCSVTVAPTSSTVEQDFTGADRTHYSNDIAWDLCRQLESEIGIQIFYLPEFDDSVEGALVTHATYAGTALDSAYFQKVYSELTEMKQAFDLYPEGFLKEVVAKKGDRTTQIVLFPADMVWFAGEPSGLGYGFHGEHVYDYSDTRTDRIYYTGDGEPYSYGHEMGHMVVSSAMIANGWTQSCDQWVSYTANSGAEGFVSSYAMASRPEDFAETWAYLWHYRSEVEAMLNTGRSEALRGKIGYLTQVLISQYSTATWDNLPWTYLLE